MDDAIGHESKRSAWIAPACLGLALFAMAVDHLLGTERDESESGLADPVTFAVSAVLCLVTAAAVFGWLIPWARKRGAERSAAVGVGASVVSVVPGIAFLWLGFPLVLAGGGVALGLEGRRGARRWLAFAAVAVGAAVLTLGAVAYAVAAIDGVSEL